MNFMGTGIYVDPNLDPLTADQPLCGTQANHCATITYVLNSRPSTTDNDVILALAGTYKPGTIAAQESFPLTLKPGMVLLCMGAGFSSVIDVSTAFATAIWGNEGAAVDNCMIKVGVDSSGIDDQATRTKINGAYIEISGSPSETSIVGVLLSNDSLLLESTVTGSAASGSVFGVQVQGGKPAIINSTISNLPIGIDLTPSAGDAVITNTNVIGIPGISTGINISTSEKPTINNTTITGHSTGVAINAGSADIVSSTLEQNGTGIMISESFSGVSPRITNSVIRLNDTGISMSFFAYPGSPRVNSSQLYCNVFTDVFVYSNINVIDLTGNAWDNAPPVVLSNSSEQCTGSGDDVCWGGTLPNTGGYRAPVGVTCPVY
jgi:hypothetical protein